MSDGQRGGAGRSQERVPRAVGRRGLAGASAELCGGSGGRTPRRGAAKREGKRRHTSWAPWAVFPELSAPKARPAAKVPVRLHPSAATFPVPPISPSLTQPVILLKIVRKSGVPSSAPWVL